MRALPIILLISLALNVFLGGFVAGRYLGRPHHGSGFERGFGPRGGPGSADLEALSPEGREVFRAAFHERRTQLDRSRLEARQLRKAFYDTLAADPFDRVRADAALDALAAAESETHVALMRELVSATEKLSPEDRKALAAAREKRRVKKLRRHGPEGPPPPE
jgi:uncharacterized membrane protein